MRAIAPVPRKTHLKTPLQSKEKGADRVRMQVQPSCVHSGYVRPEAAMATPKTTSPFPCPRAHARKNAAMMRKANP